MKNAILETLKTIDGGRATFATVTMASSLKMRKTHPENRAIRNPYEGRVTKVQSLAVTLNGNYTHAVKNQQQREGNNRNFKAKAHNFAEKMTDDFNGCLSVNRKNGQIYLNCVLRKKIETNYFVDGKPATEQQQKEFGVFVTKRNYKKVAEGQGVEKPVIYLNIKIDNIKRLTVNKETVTA